MASPSSRVKVTRPSVTEMVERVLLEYTEAHPRDKVRIKGQQLDKMKACAADKSQADAERDAAKQAMRVSSNKVHVLSELMMCAVNEYGQCQDRVKAAKSGAESANVRRHRAARARTVCAPPRPGPAASHQPTPVRYPKDEFGQVSRRVPWPSAR